MSDCPRCGESLGLLRSEDAKIGALYVHRKHGCGAVLVLVAAATPPELVVRLATPSEVA